MQTTDRQEGREKKQQWQNKAWIRLYFCIDRLWRHSIAEPPSQEIDLICVLSESL